MAWCPSCLNCQGDEFENLKLFLDEAELEQYYELFRDILKVNKLSQLKFVVSEDLMQIGLSKPEQRRYKKIYTKYFPNPYITKIKKLLNANKKSDHCLNTTVLPINCQPFSENNVKVPTKHIISIEDITINKELGMGQFGVVQQGTWTTGNQRIQVAIKCLGHERMTSNSTEFLKEAAVMHSIEHPNIVRLYGVVLHLESLMLVTELAPLRSLLECLREVSLRSSFPVPNLCEFAEQICDGMSYLENKRLIHRDLAARNILVFSKDRVKISDFGLSRALGVGKDYYQTNYNVNLKLPVAWCAPECILYLRFTSSSDVWAFGVCLWEMFTYGFQPWAAFSGQQILEAIDAPNFQRLERPELCPESYYTIMLECWAHNPNDRPKFKDLVLKLREIRPEQVQTTSDYQKLDEGRRNNLLEYKAGEIITVLGKENMTKSSMWYGVLLGGACGMFEPSQTKPYCKTDPPQQVVTPYRPSEDLDHVPLINPNSPSHLTGGGASCAPPYPLLTASGATYDPDLRYTDTKSKSLKRLKSHRSSDPTTSKSLLHKVKCATTGRIQKTDSSAGTTSKSDEVHEYHEISDTDTDTTGVDRTENLAPPESPGIQKSYGDFGQSLLDEMETMFRSLDGRLRDDAGPPGKHFDVDGAMRSHTLNKIDKQKGFYTGTMKPMTAHEEKTLETAVAMANEITDKSMNDLEGEPKVPSSPSERSKFHFKFPLVSLHHNTPHENDKDITAKHERRNFSEEANSVPDIQSTLTEESKLAYTSLIEQPTPSSSLISQIAKDSTGMYKPSTIPKPASRGDERNSLQKLMYHSRSLSPNHVDGRIANAQNPRNELPLPPRTNKSKLVDKPRHVRKYPLKLHSSSPTVGEPISLPIIRPTAIYQNAVSCSALARQYNEQQSKSHIAQNNGEDVFDGPEIAKIHTNPFTDISAAGLMNPFNIFLDKTKDNAAERSGKVEGGKLFFEEPSLVKDCTDHVSVEDLLEFADQKPCGRQRGVESDEVRIMNKVLKHQVSPEQCLEVLELSDWNVHYAIKAMKVKTAVKPEVTLEECHKALLAAGGDILKAAACLVNSR